MKKLILFILVTFGPAIFAQAQNGENPVLGLVQAKKFFEEFMDYSTTNPVELIIASTTWQPTHGSKEKFLKSIIRECKEFWRNEPCRGKVYEKLNSLFPPSGASPLDIPDPRLVTLIHNYYYSGALGPITDNSPEGMWGEVVVEVKP